jgi:hypothetical protein
MTARMPDQRFYITAVIAAGSPLLLVLAVGELRRVDYQRVGTVAGQRSAGEIGCQRPPRFVVVRLEDPSGLNRTTPPLV